MEYKKYVDFKFILSVILSTSTAIIFGMNLTIISMLKENYINSDNKIANILNVGINIFWDLIVGVLFLGGLIGSAASQHINISKKNSIILSYSIFILGLSVMFIFNASLGFLTGRFIVGVGIGIACVVVPVYISDMSPDNLRGVVGCLYQFNIIIGIIIPQAISYLSNDKNMGNYVLIGMLIICIFLLFGSFFLIDIEDVFEDEKGIVDLFKNRKSTKSILTAILFHLGQQMSGISGVISFSNSIFIMTGQEKFYTLGLGLTKLLSIGVAMILIERVGRKSLMISSASFVLFGHLFLISNIHAFIGIFFFIVGFALGLGPVVWLICGDIFPSDYKKAGLSLSIMFNWLGGFLVSSTFDMLFRCFNIYSFFGYFFCTFFILLYVIFFIHDDPKTKVADFLQ